MNTAVVNVKVNTAVKKEAQRVAEEMGLSLSAVINGFLKQLIRTKTITFSTEEEPSEFLIESLRESREDIKAGRVISFKDFGQAVDYVGKMISNERKVHKS